MTAGEPSDNDVSAAISLTGAGGIVIRPMLWQSRKRKALDFLYNYIHREPSNRDFQGFKLSEFHYEQFAQFFRDKMTWIHAEFDVTLGNAVPNMFTALSTNTCLNHFYCSSPEELDEVLLSLCAIIRK